MAPPAGTGFIAMNTALASNIVDLVLIPEVKVSDRKPSNTMYQ